MDLTKVLAELHHEKQRMDTIIMAVERVALGRRRLGRPPAWVVAASRQKRRQPEARKSRKRI